MSDPIVTFDEAAVRGELRELVRQTVKDTLNALLEEADDLVKADRYERGLTTTSGRVTLRMPKPKGRGLSGVRMFTGDKAAMAGAIAEVFPDAAYRRCTAHLHRSALSKAPKSKRAGAAAMLEAIRAQEPLDAGMGGKADAAAASLDGMRLAAVAKCVRDGVAETLTRTRLPMRRWRRIRTNNAIERLNREIRRRTRVAGTFPDGRSALMLVTARLKYVTDSEWGSRRYLDVSPLDE